MDPRLAQLQRIAASRPGVIALAGAFPARELIPKAELAGALGEVVTDREDALQYGWPEGIVQLRAWIAERLRARGAQVAPERVIITAGAQQALAIAAAALGGRAVTVGDATYAGALDAFARAGLRAVEAGGDARYVMPGISNPHGIERGAREVLLAARGPLIADEAYAELRFDGRTPRPLIADAGDRAWHVGTISKTIAPGLRLGWLVPPRAAHAAALGAKQASDLQSASVCQAALAQLLARFDYDAHLAHVRACYAARAAALADAVRRHAPGLRFREPEGGLSLWAELDEAGDELALLEEALAAGVMVDPGSAFRPAPGAALALRISFSNAPPDLLAQGAARIARALACWRRRTAVTSARTKHSVSSGGRNGRSTTPERSRPEARRSASGRTRRHAAARPRRW
jgi:2-aminoadipate transaminase